MNTLFALDTPLPGHPARYTDFAPWVSEFGLEYPYGKCQCGCDLDAPISAKNRSSRGIRKGDPQRYILGHIGKLKMYSSLEDAFFSNVDKQGVNECWLWKGTQRGNGYGCVGYQNQLIDAHRLSFEIHKGPIPDGLLVCHECDTRLCVNPKHLFLGDYGANYDDAKSKDRHTRGERSANSKLCNADIVAMRSMYKARVWGLTVPALAMQFGVGESTIHRIGQGKAWTHIKSG